ncbi:hypothetical protein, partial [Streptomyces microflavus]|uniref:hypothetical protein n=1 Tax=Streptomyces microflavus TaxID=1919 RepID=UPI0036AB7714
MWIASLAAVGCTAYSADTSWRFAANYLDMGSTVERAAMFAAAEFALFATALLARQNLNGPKRAPGLPGILTWAITAVQIVPAYAESGPVGGTVRAFVGPVMAAMLWHQAMGIELRLHTPQAASRSLVARVGREIRERALSRLGIAEHNRDAAQITRDRATRHAVALAARHAERSPKQRSGWHGRRTARRLSRAIARAQVGTDPLQRQELLHQLTARRHAEALATIVLPSPWTDPVLAMSSAKECSREGGEGIRPDDEAREHPDPEQETTDPVPAQASTTARRTGRPPDATHQELLAIGRTAVAGAGEVSRKAIVEEIRVARDSRSATPASKRSSMPWKPSSKTGPTSATAPAEPGDHDLGGGAGGVSVPPARTQKTTTASPARTPTHRPTSPPPPPPPPPP